MCIRKCSKPFCLDRELVSKQVYTYVVREVCLEHTHTRLNCLETLTCSLSGRFIGRFIICIGKCIWKKLTF